MQAEERVDMVDVGVVGDESGMRANVMTKAIHQWANKTVLS